MTEKLQKIKKELKKELDKERYQHTLGVMYTASCLAMAHGADMDQTMLAGLLHDCAKCIPNPQKVKLCEKHHLDISEVEKENPFLLHAKLGAFLAHSKYGIDDPEVLHAISVHTTGDIDMNLLDKIIFVSDYIEPHRDKAPNLTDIRKMAFEDLDRTVLKILYDTLHYLNQKKGSIDKKTHETYEYYQKRLEK